MTITKKEVAWKKSLPKKRMAAGALFLNERNEVLIVVPKYGDTWEIPGGVIESLESPREACEREIHEELGLTIHLSQLLCVDYRAKTKDHPDESVQFLFLGGILSEDAMRNISLDPTELQEYHWVPVHLIREKVHNIALSNRIIFGVKAYQEKSCIYLES